MSITIRPPLPPGKTHFVKNPRQVTEDEPQELEVEGFDRAREPQDTQQVIEDELQELDGEGSDEAEPQDILEKPQLDKETLEELPRLPIKRHRRTAAEYIALYGSRESTRSQKPS